MSVTSEITRLQNAKDDLKTAINDLTDEEHKITDETIDKYVDFFQYIDTSGGSGLPSEYQQVEYIKGTGTQWLDTGYTATNGMIAEYEVMYGSDIQTINGGYIVGSHNTYSPYSRNGGYYNNNASIKGWELGYGNFYPKSSATIEYDKKYKVKFSTISENGYLMVDDVRLIYRTDSSGMSSNTHVMIFTNAITNREGGSKTIAKVFYIKIWNTNGDLIKDYVPCYRKSDNVIGMYDLVNKEFITNQGTGTFVKGRDV